MVVMAFGFILLRLVCILFYAYHASTGSTLYSLGLTFQTQIHIQKYTNYGDYICFQQNVLLCKCTKMHNINPRNTA